MLLQLTIRQSLVKMLVIYLVILKLCFYEL